MVILLSILASFWVECSFLLLFTVGVLIRRFYFIPGICSDKPNCVLFPKSLKNDIETQSEANDPAAVLAAWRKGQSRAPTPLELFKPVVQAFIDVEPAFLIEEIVEHMEKHTALRGNSQVASVVLHTVANSGCTKILFRLWDDIHKKLGVRATYQIYEALSHGYALAGNREKVNEIHATLKKECMNPTVRCHSLIIKAYLKNSMIDATLEQMHMMKQQGLYVPPSPITQLFRVACDAGRAVEVFDSSQHAGLLSNDAVQLLLEDCVKRNDLAFAARVEQTARDSNLTFSLASYDCLLKLLTSAGDLRALQVFNELQSSSHRVGEGMYVGLIARCAETKFLKFAEEMVRHVRSQGGMTVAIYSALMKVYAYSGMYDRACDLYGNVQEDNLQPDSVMYGCLMKFAIECGRTDLSRELSERAPVLNTQSYLSLIRAAGHDKDVDQAFDVFEKLKSSGVVPSLALYNCVLDVCVSAGDTERARQVLDEIRSIGSLDVVTYNILMKQCYSTGDVVGLRAIMAAMRQDGVQPDDVSYNSLIHLLLSRGNFPEAWAMIEKMEADGIKIDHYTISILMKALKQTKNRTDVERTLLLLDQSGIDICSDEIMFNALLETCVKHHEHCRLEAALKKFSNSNLRPSVFTYGLLIKSCGALKNLDKSRALWREMIEEYSEPNDYVLVGMLDALVSNNHTDDAVVLYDTWKDRVPLTIGICSTILKGFATTKQASRAMALWREARQSGLTLNTVMYNITIDAHARIGAMESVSELVEAMATDGCELDCITYSMIVKGYCVKGDIDKAFEVFSNMKMGDPENDSIVTNTVIDGCIGRGRWHIADKVLETIESKKIKPSVVTLQLLIKLYGHRRQLQNAFKIFDEYPKKYGLVLNQAVSTSLIGACLYNKAVDKALAVFEDLKASFQWPDIKAYGAIIRGCVRHRKIEHAIALVEEAYGIKENGSSCKQCNYLPKGKRLEAETLELLFKSLQKQGLMDTLGASLIDRLLAANVSIDGHMLNSFLEASTPNKVGKQHEKKNGKSKRNEQAC